MIKILILFLMAATSSLQAYVGNPPQNNCEIYTAQTSSNQGSDQNIWVLQGRLSENLEQNVLLMLHTRLQRLEMTIRAADRVSLDSNSTLNDLSRAADERTNAIAAKHLCDPLVQVNLASFNYCLASAEFSAAPLNKAYYKLVGSCLYL